MANYYDPVEDFDLREGVLDEGILDEGIYDEGYDEASYDEALFSKKKRPVKIPSSVGRSANFARSVPPAGGRDYATKSELRNSLNSISTQVNDLKKSSLTLASSLKRLDDGYEKVVKSIAKKDRTQDSLASNTTMMSLLSTIVNKPTLNANALELVKGKDTNGAETTTIGVKQGENPIQVDLTKTMMFSMLPQLMNGNGQGGGANSGMMMMMMVLLADKDKTTSSNDLLPLVMIPMLAAGNK